VPIVNMRTQVCAHSQHAHTSACPRTDFRVCKAQTQESTKSLCTCAGVSLDKESVAHAHGLRIGVRDGGTLLIVVGVKDGGTLPQAELDCRVGCVA
jgi:hypothetical protein